MKRYIIVHLYKVSIGANFTHNFVKIILFKATRFTPLWGKVSQNEPISFTNPIKVSEIILITR